MIRDLYDERGDLVVKDFEVGLTGDERDRLDYLTIQLRRWQEIRYRVATLRLLARAMIEVSHESL